MSALRRRGRLISGFKVSLVYRRVTGQQGYGQNSYLKKPTREKKNNRVGEKEREGKKGRTEGWTDRRTD